MGQFGQELRKERESRGVALESIAGVTKISSRHLLALEEEQFKNLPGGVLSKGIVRGYARVVGLDEDAWVGRYLEAYHGSGEIKDDDAAWIEFAENVGRARKGDFRRSGDLSRWAGVVALFMLLLLFGWYVARFVSGRDALAQDELRPAMMLTKAPPVTEQRSVIGEGLASHPHRRPASPGDLASAPHAGAPEDTVANHGPGRSLGRAPVPASDLTVEAKPLHGWKPTANPAAANDSAQSSSPRP